MSQPKCGKHVRIETINDRGRETVQEFRCVYAAKHPGDCGGPPVGSREYRAPKIVKGGRR